MVRYGHSHLKLITLINLIVLFLVKVKLVINDSLEAIDIINSHFYCCILNGYSLMALRLIQFIINLLLVLHLV